MTNDYYNLTPLQEQILLVVTNPNNYHATIYSRTQDGKHNMTMQTLDARKVAIEVSKLFENKTL